MDFRLNHDALNALTAEERELLAPLLAEYEAHLVANPLLQYKPHPKQVIFHSSRKPIKGFFGGNRSGKTTAGIIDNLIQSVDEEILPPHLRPFKKWRGKFFCRIVAQSFREGLEGVIFPKIREWAPKQALKGGSFDKAYDKQRMMLQFENGNWWQFLTYEQDLDKHAGAALHRVHFDEEPPLDIRQENRMRLIDYGGDELFTMTPLLGMSWMFDGLYEPWERAQHEGTPQPHIDIVVVDMDDNPHLDQATKEMALMGLSEEERKARKEGRFVHFGGMIYNEFSKFEHVIPERAPAPDSFVYVGIDPGQRNLAAAVFVEVTGYDTLIVFDEVGIKGGTVGDMAAEVHKTSAKWGITPRMYIIDPAAKNVLHQTGRSDQMEYADHGIVTIPGQNSVTAGINRVKERLQSKTLHVTANCEGLINEFKKYRWKTPTRNEDDPKEAPIKTNDHRLDALRYVCMARPPRPQLRLAEVSKPLVEQLVDEEMARMSSAGGPTLGANQGGPGRFR